jgi:hypothetical protein
VAIFLLKGEEKGKNEQGGIMDIGAILVGLLKGYLE